jgi:hypothetical protein
MARAEPELRPRRIASDRGRSGHLFTKIGATVQFRLSRYRWAQLRKLYVRRVRGGQGELKGCAPPGGSGSPQSAAVRFNDRPTDG